MRFVFQSLLVVAAATALPAHATQLTFEGLPSLGIGTTANTSYGDRVAVAGAGVSLEGGATPNIVLNFVPLVSSNTDFEVYASGYSGLASALGDTSFNVPGYIELVPDAGWDVVLQSFDIGAWSASSYPNSQVRVVDGLGATLFDTGVFTFPGNTVSQFLSEPIRSSSALRLYVSDFGDLGIDNVRFSQVASTVPEPATWALFLAGAGVAVGRVRTRRPRGCARWPMASARLHISPAP